jgi:hypothetical protein
MKRTNSQLSDLARNLPAGNRVGHPKLDGLRWASSSVRLLRSGVVCQGHIAYGPNPGRSRDRSPLWLGIVTQGPAENRGQRYWIVYAGASPALASSAVSQRLYERTLKGFEPMEQRSNKFNLLPATQVEQELIDQLQPQKTESALAQVIVV